MRPRKPRRFRSRRARRRRLRTGRMTLLIGGASALAAFASLPRFRTSIFLSILSDIFAAETVLFGLADIVVLLGYWPKAYEDYQLPSYLPLATALFGVVIFAVSYIPFVQKMLRITDPFFAARTPITICPWPLPPMALPPKPLRSHQRLLPDPHQPVPGGARGSDQLLLPGVRQRHPGARRSAYERLLVSAAVGFHALGDDLDPGVSGRVLRALNFVLQWRRWMTASYTSRWLLNSMHYQLA